MPLTREEKAALRDRYEMWGVDAVKKELHNPQRAYFTDPEVDEFAYAWIAEQELAHSQHSDGLIKVLMIVAGIEFGVLVGQNVSYLIG
jgi:hypothetical protein